MGKSLAIRASLVDHSHGSHDSCIRIMRTELRDILLDACAKHGNVEVRWETKITAIREDKDGVVLALADGSELKGAS